MNRLTPAALVCLLPFAACAVPHDPPPRDPAFGAPTWANTALGSDPARDLAGGLHLRGAPWDRPSRGRWPEAEGMPEGAHPSPATSDYPLLDLGARVDDAVLETGYGTDLEAYLEDFSSSAVATWGLAVLTPAELFGDASALLDGLCEPIRASWSFEEDGEAWDTQIQLGQYTQLLGSPEPFLWTISDTCVDAIVATGGDLDAVVAEGSCSPWEEADFFRDGSACRACLEEAGGDWDGCVDAGACEATTQASDWYEHEDGSLTWLDVYGATWAACAPDWTAPALLMAVEGDGMPSTFDHERWTTACAPFWSEDLGTPDWLCMGGVPGETQIGTLADGVPTAFDWIRRSGSTGAPWAERRGWASEVVVQGVPLTVFWADAAGVISAPWVDGVAGGMGLNPRSLRPDGTDPTRLDDTFGRDWLATLVLKGSTTVAGVPFWIANATRCLAWSDPDEEGAHLCIDMGPDREGWLTHGRSFWVDAEARDLVDPIPMSTLASTGLPDPRIPGGLVTQVSVTAFFESPDFEDCQAFDDHFVPDVAPYDVDPDEVGSTGALWGHDYRFGKDPDPDLRMVLNTNWIRGFCPNPGE